MDDNSFRQTNIISDSSETGGRRLFFRGMAVGVLLALAFVLAFAVVRGLAAGRGRSSVLSDETESKLSTLRGLINTYYYKDVDDEALSDGVIKGLVEGLGDPYSEYFTKEEYEELIVDTTNQYAGLGAVLSQNKTTGLVRVAKIYDDSPAEKYGIKVGDYLISADGYEASEMELSEFVQHCRGEAGTTVTLVINRGGTEHTIDLVRDAITVETVSYRRFGDIGYISISEFSLDTAKEFEKALSDLKSQGIKGVIYDLRSNPGGLVASVTEILDDILPEGTTVYLMDKAGNKEEFTSDEAHQEKLPTVVLVNDASASASEIFAGAVRDFDYGTLVGTKTYGKGVVQRSIPLSDGSGLRLTIASYYTPSGECIQDKGIEPDVEVEYKYTGEGTGSKYEYDKDNQVQKAIEILKKEAK